MKTTSLILASALLSSANAFAPVSTPSLLAVAAKENAVTTLDMVKKDDDLTRYSRQQRSADADDRIVGTFKK